MTSLRQVSDKAAEKTKMLQNATEAYKNSLRDTVDEHKKMLAVMDRIRENALTPAQKAANRAAELQNAIDEPQRLQKRIYDLYENVVNEDQWHDFEPGTVLMESVKPDWDGNIFTVTYNFKHNRNGWGEKYLDTGLREAKEEEITVDGKPGKIKKLHPIQRVTKIEASIDCFVNRFVSLTYKSIIFIQRQLINSDLFRGF